MTGTPPSREALLEGIFEAKNAERLATRWLWRDLVVIGLGIAAAFISLAYLIAFGLTGKWLHLIIAAFWGFDVAFTLWRRPKANMTRPRMRELRAKAREDREFLQVALSFYEPHP